MGACICDMDDCIEVMEDTIGGGDGRIGEDSWDAVEAEAWYLCCDILNGLPPLLPPVAPPPEE
jgi:hypothetical protein